MKIHQSPWGPVQDQSVIAQGIVRVDTASHGGYFVSPARQLEMPADCRAVTPFAGRGWYEEDCDWAVVFIAFPELFDPMKFYFAVCAIQGTSYLRHLATPERKAIASTWLAENGDKWASSGGSTGENAEGKRGWTQDIYKLSNPSESKSKWFASVPILPAVFTLAEFEACETVDSHGFLHLVSVS